jgi:hypothetical protein
MIWLYHFLAKQPQFIVHRHIASVTIFESPDPQNVTTTPRRPLCPSTLPSDNWNPCTLRHIISHRRHSSFRPWTCSRPHHAPLVSLRYTQSDFELRDIEYHRYYDAIWRVAPGEYSIYGRGKGFVKVWIEQHPLKVYLKL